MLGARQWLAMAWVSVANSVREVAHEKKQVQLRIRCWYGKTSSMETMHEHKLDSVEVVTRLSGIDERLLATHLIAL